MYETKKLIVALQAAKRFFPYYTDSYNSSQQLQNTTNRM